jgi:hypothetical protein
MSSNREKILTASFPAIKKQTLILVEGALASSDPDQVTTEECIYCKYVHNIKKIVY